ncbi:T9SS type A sorting domain-containing protein [Tamlana haliotis]|uniref:T9SS type A sorting domain-containing protein n=1 Tax=Pseudotamlana haliotis TaxID=2614804 RepID=A0A6N6MEE6_9FLAO|nr:T9SS type A sorting domain-containing protein [Tamlana haliotis]KAB1067721.1 T9SS type A sorting domain-containing protein [Tamlana haliotis]
MLKNLLSTVLFTILLIQTSMSFGQASFEFIGQPEEIHPDGTLIPSDPFVFVVRDVPNGQNNAILFSLYPYPDGVNMNAFRHGWQSGSDKVRMTLSKLNDPDVNNGFFKTETVDNSDGTFTKTYTISNVSRDVTLGGTAKNGGMTDGVSYAPIVRIIQANAQILDSSGQMATGDNPFEVDQESLDRSPDYITTSFAFSYYPPEENATTGGGEHPHVAANASIDLYDDGTGSGKQNQIISFTNQIIKKYSTADPFTISATSSSGLANITYSVVSGPATISGNTVTLDGNSGGIVTIEAAHAGDSNYNASENYLQFEVVDLSIYSPTITTRLTEDYPLEMPSLYAYPIYVTPSIEEPGVLSIDRVEISVNDVPVTTGGENGSFFGLWTPDSYGSHTVKIIAYATNGTSTTMTKNIEVTDVLSTQSVKTMDEVVIEYGLTDLWHYGTYTLPQHVGGYNEIIATMLVECPSATGNCDDWDRLAYIDIMGPDGNWIQIIRYATPYGVGCSHTIDLTDYASLLQGEVQLRMYIATFGTGGWQISLDFDYEKGTPEYLYSKVDELWDGTWEFGNPTNLQPIPVNNYTYDSNVLKSHLRLSTTGHGWGANNSQNAAEFYEAYHFIDVDGLVNTLQNTWKICNPNPDNCIGQRGEWAYNRSGWCPGAISPPDIYDMTPQIAKGTVDFGYRFDTRYVDYCHPDNPDCISGTTCDNCNDTGNARYVVDGQLINFSNSPLVQGTLGIEAVDNSANYKLRVFPNPSNGIFKITTTSDFGKSLVDIVSISGEIIKSYTVDSSEQLNNMTFNLSSLASGFYFVTIENNAGIGNLKIVIN